MTSATYDCQDLVTFVDSRRNDDAGGLSGADSRAGVHGKTVLTVDSQISEHVTQHWRRQIHRHFVRLQINATIKHCH